MKGKNFSSNQQLSKRNKDDFYQTPKSLTRLLMNEITLKGTIFEPCAGDGAIVDVLKEYYYNVHSADKEEDFLKATEVYDTVITNPPYRFANDMLLKSFEIAQDVHFLLPLSYLQGIGRYNTIYNHNTHYLSNVRVFTRYPLFEETVREDGFHNTGMMSFAWFSFKIGKGETKLSWLNNDDFIIRKNKP